MKTFQVVILGIFGFFAIAGVVAFALFRGPDSSVATVPVELWGTLPAEVIQHALDTYNSTASEDLLLIYREIRPEEFEDEFVNAIAEGRGPDMVLVREDTIEKYKTKLHLISFDSYPLRDFQDTFVEAGEIFITADGIVGLPFVIDPMVLYWNRDMFASSGRVLPPATWEDLVDAVGRITKRDVNNNILTSAIALGEFRNITHAKEILAMLFLQAGDDIVTRDAQGNPTVVFGRRFNQSETPAESVLRFYTEFANPVKALYSWNRSLPMSRDSFLAEDLAMYLGFASDAEVIASRNPNLNVDAAIMPQIVDTQTKKTFAHVYALALTRTASNAEGSFRALGVMTDPTFLAAVEEAYGLPPVRRDMLAPGADTALAQTFYDSAIIADTFLDPDPDGTRSVFQRMVEDVTTSREGISSAISNAHAALAALIGG